MFIACACRGAQRCVGGFAGDAAALAAGRDPLRGLRLRAALALPQPPRCPGKRSSRCCSWLPPPFAALTPLCAFVSVETKLLLSCMEVVDEKCGR